MTICQGMERSLIYILRQALFKLFLIGYFFHLFSLVRSSWIRDGTPVFCIGRLRSFTTEPPGKPGRDYFFLNKEIKHFNSQSFYKYREVEGHPVKVLLYLCKWKGQEQVLMSGASNNKQKSWFLIQSPDLKQFSDPEFIQEKDRPSRWRTLQPQQAQAVVMSTIFSWRDIWPLARVTIH